MIDYSEEDIKELHNELVERLDEEIATRPADGHIPDHKLFDVLDDAFEESPVDHPRK